MKRIYPVLLVLAALFFTSGCVSGLDAARESLDAVNANIVQAQADLAREQAVADAMDDANPQKAIHLRRVANLRNYLDQAQPIAANLSNKLASAEDGADVMQAAGETVRETFPGIYGSLAAMFLLTGASIWRAFVVKRAATQIATSVNPIMADASTEQRLRVATEQGTTAKRIVDEAQGKTRGSLPI